VRLPDGKESTPFPAYHGLADQLTKAQRQQRLAFVAPQAPAPIQKMFDDFLQRLAVSHGYATAKEFVAKEHGGVVYHFGINYMGAHTIHHTDEYLTDGPGHVISNLVLQGSGLLYFYEDRLRPDSKEGGHEDDRAAYAAEQRPGDCIEFSDDARVFPMHGVVKDLPMVELPRSATRTKPAFDGTPGWDENMRVVATIRGGELHDAHKLAWKDMWDPAYPKGFLDEKTRQATEVQTNKQPHKQTHTHKHAHTHTHTHTHKHTLTPNRNQPGPNAPRAAKTQPQVSRRRHPPSPATCQKTRQHHRPAKRPARRRPPWCRHG
jgi:hypothetical protein